MLGYAGYAYHAVYDMRKVADGFNPKAGFEKSLRDYRTFCDALKVLALHELFAECHPAGFFRYLHAAAVNWETFLARVHTSHGQYRVPASLNEPLLGAIICGRFTLAREIAELSSRERRSPEYEDEFYVASFFQELLKGPPIKGETRGSLTGLCALTDAYLGRATPRTEVLHALASANEESLWPAFEAWSESATREIAARADAPAAPYYSGITRYLWVEGFAVLRLAQWAGFTVPATRFRFIPWLVLPLPRAVDGVATPLLGEILPEQLGP